MLSLVKTCYRLTAPAIITGWLLALPTDARAIIPCTVCAAPGSTSCTDAGALNWQYGVYGPPCGALLVLSNRRGERYGYTGRHLRSQRHYHLLGVDSH